MICAAVPGERVATGHPRKERRNSRMPIQVKTEGELKAKKEIPKGTHRKTWMEFANASLAILSRT